MPGFQGKIPFEEHQISDAKLQLYTTTLGLCSYQEPLEETLRGYHNFRALNKTVNRIIYLSEFYAKTQ